MTRNNIPTSSDKKRTVIRLFASVNITRNNITTSSDAFFYFFYNV